MDQFYFIAYIISLIIAVLTLFAVICFAKWRLYTLNILPKALRLYFLVCGFPCILASIFAPMYIAIHYLIYNTQQGTLVEVLRYFVSFSAQQIRQILFTIVLERIVATVYLEKYTLPYNLKLFIWLSLYTYVTTFLYTGFTFYGKVVPNMLYLFDLTNYFMFALHAVMICGCTILHRLNKRMYRLSVYRISLQKRYQIFENVKVLTYIFPPILTYALLAHFGSTIAIICINYKLWTNPLCMWHIFYNLPILIICTRFLLIPLKTNDISKTKVVTIVKNAFGKSLPAVITTDKYFKDLQQQWK